MLVAANVDGDAVQPSPRIAFDPAEVPKQPQKHLLHGILRVFDPPQESVSGSQNQALMDGYQVLKDSPLFTFPGEDRQR
jgi:hypothetical protein